MPTSAHSSPAPEPPFARVMQSVLTIDDSPAVHAFLEARLGTEGLVLHHAMRAGEGLAKARALQPDLILLDLHLPEMSGFDVCRLLKEDPATEPLPVIFLTSRADVETKVRAFELGAIDYVTKPFEPVELRARVRAALRTKRFQDMLASRALLDALTALWNRAYFGQRLSEELAATRRYGRNVSLVLVDVDRFAEVNERHTHPFGDCILQSIGELLSATLRATDAPCRYGSEQFALVLSETTCDEAMGVAERVRAKISEIELFDRGALVHVTASAGVSSTDLMDTPTLASIEALVSAAADALHEAKRAGRDRVVRAGPILMRGSDPGE